MYIMHEFEGIYAQPVMYPAERTKSFRSAHCCEKTKGAASTEALRRLPVMWMLYQMYSVLITQKWLKIEDIINNVLP